MMKNAGLSAAEAFVLMSLPRYDARQAVKLGFMGLLAQGILRIEQEERPGFFRTRSISHLRVVANPPKELPPVAASLVKITQIAAPGGLMADIVGQTGYEYGRSFAGFVRNLVGPALVARGLAERRVSRLLGLVPLTRFHRTPAGEAENTRLQDLLQEARAIPQYLDSDPARVAELVGALGGAIFLVEGLRPHYAALERALRPADGGGDGAAGSWGNEYPSGDHADGENRDGDHFGGLSDFGSFDFGSVDFGAFDAGAFDSFDSGFSDAGGDGGGGDGGGGDGGGSSGC
jgi:hypothetical protein